ncbi:unnamed protein product, partial [Porites evermanni]
RPNTINPTPAGEIPPSLDILFDFSSSSDHTVKIGDKTTIVTNRECSHGFLYNPFTEKCVRLHVVDPTLTGRQITTYVGCAISITSLILLLGVYIIFPELRTLPGKNLMSLSISMLFYHTFFLMSGQTNRPHLGMAVSILLHYFLLSTFFWMSVMAFDVAKTFLNLVCLLFTLPMAQTHDIGREVQSNSRTVYVLCVFEINTTRVFCLFCFVFVLVASLIFILGVNFCWISNGKALLVVLGVPVPLILMFNCVAITITLLSIWKVQKITRRVTDQKASLSILCIKLSSALGFTWLLGFIVPFAEVDFLTYLFVICNSLQGFFIFLAFVANKRTLVKVKCAWGSLSKSDGSTNTTSNTGRNRAKKTSKDEQLAATTAL